MLNLFFFFICIKINFGKKNSEEEEKIIFKCTDLYDSKCMTYDWNEEQNEIIYMIGEKCSNDKVCNRVCVKKFTELFFGSRCNYNEECLSNKCEKNVCSSNTKNCYDYYDCEPGYYCNQEDNTCKKMGQKDENCTHLNFDDDDFLTTDEDKIFGTCSYGLVCNNNKCVEIGSLEDGVKSDNKYACKNFVVYNDECTSLVAKEMDEDGYCYYSPENNQTITLNYECPYTLSDGKYINYGKKIIENWNNFVNKYKKVLNSIDQTKFIRKKKLYNMLFLENKELIDSANKLGLIEGLIDVEQNCVFDLIYNRYIYEENNDNNENIIKISNIYLIILIILLI